MRAGQEGYADGGWGSERLFAFDVQELLALLPGSNLARGYLCKGDGKGIWILNMEGRGERCERCRHLVSDVHR